MFLTLLFIEVISFIIGVYFWKKKDDIPKRYFIIYLGLIVFAELTNEVLQFFHIQFHWFFTYFIIPLEFLFFHWLFYQFSTIKEKRRIIVCGVIYIIAFFIERVLLNDPQKYSFSSFSYTIGNCVLLFIIFQYFIRLVNSDRILYFYHERLFWISCGLLLFYLGTSPYYGLNNYLYNSYPNIFWTYTYVMYFLNCSMYLLFAASFIWGKEK